MSSIENHIYQASELLRKMVTIPALSREEGERADFICNYITNRGINIKRIGNNIIASLPCENRKPILMLNSHIDTVKPSSSYSYNPFSPPFEEEKICGLGSNDAGASVVSMLHSFFYLTESQEIFSSLNVNPNIVLTAEEEISGSGGMKLIEPILRNNVDFAIIGEPTGMKAAIAERGLLVIDAISYGKSGHSAMDSGCNAIYIALNDIEVLKNYNFPKKSKIMGNIKVSVTQINGGYQHNIIPDKCSFVIDIRTTDMYNNNEIMEILKKELKSELKVRSIENKTSFTPENHPLMKTIKSIGTETIISPTTSDWIRINMPAIKMGPGSSVRSHKEDEFILLSEIDDAVRKYINFIRNINI